MSTIMQKSGLTPSQGSTTPFFSTPSWGSGTASNSKGDGKKHSKSNSASSTSRSRPGTSSGIADRLQVHDESKDKDRKPSYGRKSSFTSPAKGRRRSSLASNGLSGGAESIKTDASRPPAIPDFARAATPRLNRLDFDTGPLSPTSQPDPFSSFSRPSGRLTPNAATQGNMTSYYPFSASSPPLPSGQAIPPIALPEGSSSMVHQHIFEMSNKRISTLVYLRKAHEGRLFWFNTIMFDKPDLARMPYFDSRKMARRATNYLLLGLSLPIVIDLNSATPLEFLRSLNTLLTEFESYQQIHTENGVNTSSFSRGRIPQMFRRGPGGKGRRQSGAGDLGYAAESVGGSSLSSGSAVNAPTSVINFGLGGEGNDLLPGEEYTHLLTPNLPFEPDFFETFATLCDVLIDCYSRLMNLLPTPKDCNPAIADLFAKADGRMRKIIVQGVVKEFETSSRSGLRQEIENVGKVVLGGLM